MKRDRAAFLWDLQQACSAISTFVSGATLERYASELLLQSAVERQLQNIGEALSQLSRLDPVLAARASRASDNSLASGMYWCMAMQGSTTPKCGAFCMRTCPNCTTQ